jgi:hypothetical protein
MAIHEAIEHARPGGLADGSRNSRSRAVGLEFDIHTLMLNEVWMPRKL